MIPISTSWQVSSVRASILHDARRGQYPLEQLARYNDSWRRDCVGRPTCEDAKLLEDHLDALNVPKETLEAYIDARFGALPQGGNGID